MFKLIWEWFYVRPALRELREYGHCVLQGVEWSHARAIYVIESLLARKFDVRVEDYIGGRSRRFIVVMPGTGKYEHRKHELNIPIPTYPGAHNYH